MICPKCQNDMEAIEYDGIEVDRCKTCQKQPHIQYEECTSCRGSFFDAGEFADLMQLKNWQAEKG